ncbi:MAG: hypothetical protein IJW23_02405, partial [Lentisphaeria bacterium]|nr:hypothetical protein [Lentisphaeria bacterium]
ICKWSVFGLSSIASAKEDGSHAQTTISNSSTIFFQPNFAGLLKLPHKNPTFRYQNQPQSFYSEYQAKSTAEKVIFC